MRDTYVMTDETPRTMMEWFFDNPPEPPPCDACGAEAYSRPEAGGVLHLRRQHLHTCPTEWGTEIVIISPGSKTSTLG